MPAVGPKLNGLMVIACTMHTRKPNWIEPIPTASLSARSHPQTRNHRPLSSLHKCGASANTAAASPPLLTPVRSAPSHQPPPSRTPIPFGDLAGVVCSSSPDCRLPTGWFLFLKPSPATSSREYLLKPFLSPQNVPSSASKTLNPSSPCDRPTQPYASSPWLR